jgi:RNA polymerase sigma factor (sigma-70 family)
MHRKTFDSNNLLQELKVGNAVAIEYFFKQHHRVMCQFANKLIKDLNKADIIYCDVISRQLLPGIDRFNSIEEIKCFLFDAIEEACMQFLRDRDGGTRKIEYSNSTTQISPPEDPRGRMDAEVWQEIHDRIDSFPRNHKYVFNLYYVHGRRNKEVAEFINKPPQEVYRLRKVCVKWLKKAFEDRDNYQQHFCLLLRLSRFKKDVGFDTE